MNLATWMLPFAIVLFLVSAALWWLGRRADETAADTTPATAGTDGAGAVATRSRTDLPTWVMPVLAGVAVVVAAITLFQTFRVGDAGAHAAWDYVKKLK